MDAKSIPYVDKVIDLGVTMDKNLNFLLMFLSVARQIAELILSSNVFTLKILHPYCLHLKLMSGQLWNTTASHGTRF